MKDCRFEIDAKRPDVSDVGRWSAIELLTSVIIFIEEQTVTVIGAVCQRVYNVAANSTNS